jgi:hypothetical protein
MWCAGIRKTYWITCNNDTEMQNVMVERSSFPSHLVIKPKDLGRLLGHFQSSLQEITLIATEPASTDIDSDSEAKAIELKSYIDPARGEVAIFHLSASNVGACLRSTKFVFSVAWFCPSWCSLPLIKHAHSELRF